MQQPPADNKACTIESCKSGQDVPGPRHSAEWIGPYAARGHLRSILDHPQPNNPPCLWNFSQPLSMTPAAIAELIRRQSMSRCRPERPCRRIASRKTNAGIPGQTQRLLHPADARSFSLILALQLAPECPTLHRKYRRHRPGLPGNPGSTGIHRRIGEPAAQARPQRNAEGTPEH
jgi:hypothetical protein